MTEVIADNRTMKPHDIKSLLYGEERDFLVRKNGDQVKVGDLEGKVIGLYFSASYYGPAYLFTPKLVEAYDELSQMYSDFEVVFVSDDWDEESFCEYLSGMPWVAIPFADSATRKHLQNLFCKNLLGMSRLVVLDKNGEVVNSEGVLALRKYGSRAYPFTQERIDLLNADLEDAKRNQTLRSVLVSSSRDFLISNNGNKVPVSDLEGKIVCLYLSFGHIICSRYDRFTLKLVEMYKRLKDRGESFEVVQVSLHDDESLFQLGFATVPWLAIPFKDKSCESLSRYFEHFETERHPMLSVIGFDGKTLVRIAAKFVEKHGTDAYPFSLQKMEELAEKEKAIKESQNLLSLLVSWEGDYVIGNGDVKIPVSKLVGKNILLYFSSSDSGSFEFLPKLIETYHKIKAKDTNFEIIFLSDDDDQTAFDNYFSSMPWLAVPFGDGRERLLRKICPRLLAIGPNGRPITGHVKEMIMAHGAEAYPFTEERLKEVEDAKQWPERLHHPLHKEHVLLLTKRNYTCNECNENGRGWMFYIEDCDLFPQPPICDECKENGGTLCVYCQEDRDSDERLVSWCHVQGGTWCFYCEDCDFSLHPKCALKEGPNLCDSFMSILI